uniref:Uncharacterized protein n=1 Tax=Ciona savignyi TaxID=51511 RepID=H2Y725_CIOSA
MARYKKVLAPPAGEYEDSTSKLARRETKMKRKREGVSGGATGGQKRVDGKKKKKEKGKFSARKSAPAISDTAVKRRRKSKPQDKYKVESGDSIHMQYQDEPSKPHRRKDDGKRPTSHTPSVVDHFQQAYSRNKNMRMEQDEAYRVVLIPGDNPGVKWVTAVGLLGATILLFTVWGFALNYILTPAPQASTGEMITEPITTTAGY